MVTNAAYALVILAIAAVANAAPEVQFVGSRVCAGCHKALFDKYVRTAMGRSMATVAGDLPVKVGTLVNVQSTALNRNFEVFRKDGKLHQSEYQLDGGQTVFRTTHELAYAVGSGVNGISFMVRRGDRLFQAPLSFYSRSEKWDLSPGYEAVDQGFSRPIHAACISCHAGRSRPVLERTGMYNDPPFEELSIGCENCHGPGQLHVTERGKRAAIVNPRRLSPRLAEDICASCHQAGDTRVLQPGKKHGDFRPGTPLSDTLAVFKLPSDDRRTEERDLLEHHSAMQLSLCYTSSKGSFSCLTCHNPHNAPDRDSAAASYRAKCLTCHADASCELPPQRRALHQPANDCAGCHMPKRPVTGISHSALTNHRIVRLPGQPLPERISRTTAGDPPGLIFWNKPSKAQPLSAVVRLTAYGELMDRALELREHYLAALEEARSATPHHPLVLAALGRKALREMNAQSVDLLRSAVAAGSTTPTTFLDLAEALSRYAKLEEAAETLKRGLALEPYSKDLRKSLILRYIAAKEYALARNAMQEYLRFFPEDSFMRGLLQKVGTDPAR